MDKIYKNKFSKYGSITLCNIHFWTANIATCFAISSNWQKQLDRVGKRWLAKCRLSQQGLETALLTRLQLGECTHSYNQPVLNRVITFSWGERVVLKICRKTAYSRGGEEEWDTERREGCKEINSWKIKERMDMERLTKIPSGKIIQGMEKETKGLAGEQDWLLMP